MNHQFFDDAQTKRKRIIQDLNLPLPNFLPLAVVYLWLTKYCPVNCDHCMFASPNIVNKNSKFILSNKAIKKFITLSHESKLDTLVISGGGEPLLELSKVINVIKNAHYKNLEIITSGYWTSTKKQISNILNCIQRAISFKNKLSSTKVNFSFRISVDKYHQKKIKLIWLKNLIDIIIEDQSLPAKKRKYPDIKIYLRSLLIKDSTVDEFVNLLKGRITKMNNFVRTIYLPENSFEIKVFYKEMRFVGRAKNLNEKKLISFKKYFSQYCDKNNDIRLGMTFLDHKSKGEILNGINVFITSEGKIFPYGGTPDIYAQLDTDFTYKDFLEDLFQDIVSRTLLERGLNFIKEIALEVESNINKKIIKKNWLASIADESLATPEIRLYVTIRLIQKYLELKIINRKDLSDYLKEIVSIKPKKLKEFYKDFIKNKKNLKYSYANEQINFCIQNKRGNNHE